MIKTPNVAHQRRRAERSEAKPSAGCACWAAAAAMANKEASLSAFASILRPLTLRFEIRLRSNTARKSQVFEQYSFYFAMARNPNCASKGSESEKVTTAGVVGSYDAGGTAEIVYSCSIQLPGDQIKMLNQPSP